jgi:peptidoglycan/xylan/chitin deacetylase (PgdA/CDA1 family)
MKTIFKAILAWLLATMLHPRLLRLFHRGPLTILTYHGIVDRRPIMPDPCLVNIDAFRSQMQYLKKHFNVVSMTRAVQLIEDEAIIDPTVVITFDDGYQNNFDLAYPVLREEKQPATIFLSTSFADSDTTIWTGIIQNAFARSSKSSFEWRGQRFDLGSLEQRKESMEAVKSLLKDDPQESLFAEVDSIVEILSDGDPISLEPDSPYRMLTSESIKSLAESDLIELGAHTHSHYILSRIPASVQEVEIRSSLDFVASYTGETCRCFAYPNGRECDYDDDSLAILREAGVKAAVTMESGTCNINTPILELKRIAVSGNADMSSFKLSLFDIPGRLKRLLARKG